MVQQFLTRFLLLAATLGLVGCKEVNVYVRHGEAPPPPPPAVIVATMPTSAEVLTRGPVNEAFAEPVMTGTTGTIVVSRAPPPPIREQPPAEVPAGMTAAWVPGYWAWDDDRGDFLWVSGCWRVPPPGCSWIPGYWLPVTNGWQWIPGFWHSGAGTEVEYLPQPPAPPEVGPLGPPPSPDGIWVPGCWYREGPRFVWHPGFWEAGRADWVWVPAHYVCTPRGCIFVPGYWDYNLSRRGVLFAPCYFGTAVYAQPGFVWSPTVVIETNFMYLNFFARPGYCHYYFGDYYEARYAQIGIFPWYECRDRHEWYDPIFYHQEWRHRDNPRWFQQERETYDRRRADVSARPPRTFVALQNELHRNPQFAQKNVLPAEQLSQVAKSRPAEFQKLPENRRVEVTQQANDLHKYREQRAQWERGTVPTQPGQPGHAPGTLAPAAVTPHPMPPAEVHRPAPPSEIKQPAPPAEIRHPAPPAEIRRPEPPGRVIAPEKIQIPRSPIYHHPENAVAPPPHPEVPKGAPGKGDEPGKGRGDKGR